MTVALPAGLAKGMIRRRQSFVLVVDAPDMLMARQALADFRERLWPCPSEDEHDPRWHRSEEDCPGPKLVSDVIPLPTGGAILVDAGDTPDGFLRTVPDLLRSELERAGLETASVRLATDTGLIDELWRARHVVLLLAVPLQEDPSSARAVPTEWIEAGTEWLGGGPARAIVGPVDVGVVTDASVCEAARLGNGTVELVSGDPGSSFRLFFTSDRYHPFVAFVAGGEAMDAAARVEAAEALVELARRLAGSVGLAFISFEPDLHRLGPHYRPPHPPLDATGGPAGTPVFATLSSDYLLLSSEIVLDAFPYQVLTAAHVERLGPAADLVPIEGVDPPRFELRLGEFAEWLPEDPARDAAIAAGRTRLASAMIDDLTALQEVRART